MTRLHHILSATDLSEASLYAVDRGFQIASTSNAQFTILYALGIQAMAPLREVLGEQADTVVASITDDVHDQLRKITSDASRNCGISAQIALPKGLATYDLPVYVDKANVNLLLIGAHGSDSDHPSTLGATTTRLIHKSQCPVLIVRQPPRGAYQRIFVAIDFSPASEKAVHLAREIAPQAHLILSHVTHVPFENKIQHVGVNDELIAKYRVSASESASRQLHALALGCGLKNGEYSEHVFDGKASVQILSCVAKEACDLVVVGKHGLHVTDELHVGSVTTRIASASPCDVLIVFDKQIRDGMDFAA